MADMSVAQIIKNEFRINSIPGINTPEEYAYYLKQLLQTDYKMIHSGDYLFVYKEIGNGVVELSFLEGKNSDRELLNNLFKALLQLRQDKYREADIPFNREELISLFRKLPVLPVSIEKTQGDYVAKVRLA